MNRRSRAGAMPGAAFLSLARTAQPPDDQATQRVTSATTKETVMSVQSSPAHLSALLSAVAARWPQKEAIVFQNTRLTWGAIEEQATNLAAAFIALGIQPGDRIGIQCATRPEYIITYLAAMRCGAVLAGFNSRHTPLEVSRLARLANPVLLVMQAEAAQRLYPFLPALDTVRQIVIIGEAVPATAQRWRDLCVPASPAALAALAARQAHLSAADDALIVFTGGSTGFPKGARLSHANILSNIEAQVRHLDFRHDDRIILHLPMNHVSGSVLISIAALMTGATLIMMEAFDPVETLALVARERVTILGQVPTMWVMESLLTQQFDLSSLRMTITAGAPTPPAAMRWLASLAPIAVHGYGLTEVAGMVTYTPLDAPVETLLQSVGRVAPEFELRLVDATQRPLQIGAGGFAEGEIVLRGGCVMQGYIQADGDNDTALAPDGWLYTGDLGRLDAHGNLRILGRRKEMLITGGFNVYPAEIEAYIAEHPQVALCACLGIPDPVMGELGLAFVVPRPGPNLTLHELRLHCRQGLARYKIPAEFRILPALPMTDVGKVDKQALAALI